MKINDLLEVAKGMGFCAHTDTANVYIMQSSDETEMYKFNPTIGDLILWLMERGNLDLYDNVEVSFHMACCNDYHSQSELSLKENLLSIVLQVIRAEKEK